MTDSTDWCRHCGEAETLTEEHLPPRVTGNAGEGRLFVERFGVLDPLRDYEDGHSIRSLCDGCNNKGTTRGLVKSYERFDADVKGYVNQAAAAFVHASGEEPQELWSVVKPNREAFMLPMDHGLGADLEQRENLCPGSIARHILGMVLAVQETRILLEAFPEAQEAYSTDEATTLGRLSLHVALADAGLQFLTHGAMDISLRLDGSEPPTTSNFWMVSFPPFLFILAEGPTAPITATRIDHWLAYPSRRQFSKKDRRVSYPIAHKGETLVGLMYQRLELSTNPVGT
jgi:hypothetical protein